MRLGRPAPYLRGRLQLEPWRPQRAVGKVQGRSAMNHYTPFRFRRAIVFGLVVATAAIATSTAGAAIDPRFVNPTAGAFAAPTGQFALPPGATVDPVAASAGQFGLPPGATVEPVAASAGQFGLPPGATVEPVAASAVKPSLNTGPTVQPFPAPTEQPGGAQAAPVLPSPVVEVPGGLDWADAGIGAGIAFGGILLLGGALLVVRRSTQRHRLATD
jgi:hypothetical protein